MAKGFERTKHKRLSARGIIIKDGKIFAQKLKASKSDFWCTPGGGVDDGESILDAVKRELTEETGVTPVVGRLLFVQQFTDDYGSEQIEFFFHILNPDDFENINLEETTHGELEIAEYGFIDPKTSVLLPDNLKSIDFSQIDDQTKPVQFFYHE